MAGQGPGGPGDLEVIAAGVGVYIQKLTGKIQIRQQAAAHGGRIHLPDADAAAGDDGPGEGSGGTDGQRQGLQGFGETATLLSGDLVAAERLRQAAELRKDSRQTCGQEAGQLGGKQFFSGGGEIPQQAGVQLLRGEAGLQVDPEGGFRKILRQMTAGFQHQGAGNAEMGEEHFAQLSIQHFFAPGKGEGHISEAQPLEGTGPGFHGIQPDQHGRARKNGMACRFGEAVAVAGGAGGRKADAAGTQNH